MTEPRSAPAPRERLATAVRRCAAGLAAAGVMSCFINLLQLLMPFYTLQVYDRVLSSRSVETLTLLTVLVLVGLVVFAVLEYLRGRVLMVLGALVSWHLDGPALAAAIEGTVRGQGGRAAQAVRDINDLRLFLGSPTVTVPLDILWTPVFIGVLFLLHPLYGGIALGAAALLVGLGVLVERSGRGSLAAANVALQRSYAHVGSAVRNAEAIEAMGMTPAVTRVWHRSQADALGQLDRGSQRAKAIAAGSKAVRAGLQAAVIAAGVVLVLAHEASPGSIVAASIIMGRTLFPFEQLIDGWRSWAFAIAAWRRVRALIGGEDGGGNGGQGVRRQTLPLPRPVGGLVVDRVTYLPPGAERPVLRGVSFSAEPGEVVGIVGPSAAGKSTLARLLVGVLAPTGGGIYLDGNNVFLWERESFGQAVGYLPQSVLLLDATVRENIARLTDADPAEVVAAARSAGVHEMIGRLPRGYDTPIGEGGIGEGGHPLSGGQRQRIALARALFGEPRLLVLDEPNANLDHDGETALVEAIARARAGGAIVLLIAHRPALMAVADTLLVLRDGMVERCAPRAEVMETVLAPRASGAAGPTTKGTAVVASPRPRVAANEGRGGS